MDYSDSGQYDDDLGLDDFPLDYYEEGEEDLEIDDDDNDDLDCPAVSEEGHEASGQKPLDDSSIELKPHERLVPGSRLATLFEALEKNRAVQASLRAIMAKADVMISRNWNDMTHMERRRSRVREVAFEQEGQQQQEGAGARMLADEPCRPEPDANATSTRFWKIQGRTPQPNSDSLALAAARVSNLPDTFERSRWGKERVDQLKKGINVEVQLLMSERVMKRHQERAVVGQQGRLEAARMDQDGQELTRNDPRLPNLLLITNTPSASNQLLEAAANGDQLETFESELALVRSVSLDSPEARKIIHESFGPQQWERIALTYVRDRSPADCRSHYFHSLAPQVPWCLEESACLRSLVEEHKSSRWEKVSRELGSRGYYRTPVQCLEHHIKFSRPDHVKGRVQWTVEDDAKLRLMVERHGTKWVKIASEMGGRFDRHQLRDRWHGQTQRMHERNTGRWSQGEDDRLKQALQDYGSKWPAIASAVLTRTAQQCRERYNNVLRSDIKLEPFTREEQERLSEECSNHLKAHGRIIWKDVALLFEGRTDEVIRRAWRGISGPRGESRVHSSTPAVAQFKLKGGRKAPSGTRAANNKKKKAKRSRKEIETETDE